VFYENGGEIPRVDGEKKLPFGSAVNGVVVTDW